MAELPTHDRDELVTKDFLRAELAEFRSELRSEMQRLHRETLVAIIPALIGGMALAAAIS